MRAFLVAGLVGVGCGGGGATPPDAPPPDAPPVPIDAALMPADPIVEGPDCGGHALIAHQGDLSLAVSALRVASLAESFDLDGDGQPDNKMSAIAALAQSQIDDGLKAGTLVVPIEIFDRGADPDPCVKLGWYGGSCVGACDLTDATADTVSLDPATIGAGGVPTSRLRAMATSATGDLSASPGFLLVTLPVTAGMTLVLPVGVQHVDGKLAGSLTGMRIGGTMQAFQLDRILAPQSTQIGTMPGDTLLDIFFANLFGPLVALPLSTAMAGCRTADIDIDGDGLESFCDSNPNDEIKRVDTCIDGDGTIVHDGDDGVASCTDAMVGGVRRFPDGISVGLVLDAKPVTIAP